MASELITTELVALDADFGDSVDSVITNLATLVHDTGRATDVAGLAQPAIDRETKAGTGVPGGVAIPHCRSEAVTEPTLAFARLGRGVDFSGPDGDAQLVFLIAAPAGGGKAHLKILSKLARALVRKDFLEALRSAPHQGRNRSPCLGCSQRRKAKEETGHRVGCPRRWCRRYRLLLRLQRLVLGRDPNYRGFFGQRHPHRGHHRLPYRHRPHLHGGRRPHTDRGRTR